MKRSQQKLLCLAILSIFLYNGSPLLLNINNITTENRLNQKENSNEIPYSSAGYAVNSMTINSTSFSEDGIYYCFRNDSLDLRISTTSVTNPKITINNSAGVPSIVPAGTSLSGSGDNWNILINIPGTQETGMYSAILYFNNDIKQNFFFNLSIMNPQPRIIEAVFDETLNGKPISQRIYEGDTLPIYKTANFNITCFTVNEDELSKISKVELTYQNASESTWKSVELTKQMNVTKSNYITTKFALSTNITILPNENWSVGQFYRCNITVYDSENEKYIFDFRLLVSNIPPVISEFSVDGACTSAQYFTKSQLDFLIHANGTDLESTSMFGNNLYNISRTLQPIQANITSPGTIVNSSILRVISSDGLSHDITFSTGIYMINFTTSQDYDFRDSNLYKDLKLNILFNTKTTKPNLNIEIFNYTSNSWVSLGTNILASDPINSQVAKTFLNTNTYDNSIRHFFDSKLRTNNINFMQIRIYSPTSSTDLIGIDRISLGFKIYRRIDFSDIYLTIYKPLSNYASTSGNAPTKFNMINNYKMDWDNSGNTDRWSFNYSLPITNGSVDFIGAWSFVLEAFDYGTASYASLNPNEIDGINKLSAMGWFQSDKTRSYVIASLTVNVGIDPNGILSFNQTTSNITAALAGNDIQVTVGLNDQKYLQTYEYLNTTMTPELDEFEVQRGDPWVPWKTGLPPPDYDYQPYDEYNQLYKSQNRYLILDNSETLAINRNDSQYFKFIPNCDPYGQNPYYNLTFALVMPYHINSKYWLTADNISRMYVETTQHIQQDSLLQSRILYKTEIQFWDWSQQKWILPQLSYSSAPGKQLNDPTLNDNSLLTYGPGKTWRSGAWSDNASILNCIERNYNNLMYVRIFYNIEQPLTLNPQYLNISIDYFNLTVEYHNSYTAKLRVWDSENNTLVQEYSMKQSANPANLRYWTATLPLHLFSARNYHFAIWAQNANSSIYYDSGQIQGQFKSGFTGVYSWIPFINSSISINQSFNLMIIPAAINVTTKEFATITNINRYQEKFQFNGTIAWNQNINQLTAFSIQLRQYNMQDPTEWITLKGNNRLDPTGLNLLLWDNVTNTWNVSMIFSSNKITNGITWRSGVWYYRIIVKSNESVTNATDWGVFRLHNYQPQNIVVQDLANGTYERVIRDIPFQIAFDDYEANNLTDNPYLGSEFDMKIYITVRNRYNGKLWEKWDSKAFAPYANRIVVGNRFTLKGNINFSQEVDITNPALGDYYSEVYIQIKDDDIDWPQYGTKRFNNRNFTVVNNKPFVQVAFTSDKQNNEVYRNDTITSTVTLYDYDDYSFHVLPTFLNLTYNVDYNGTTNTVDMMSKYVNSSWTWNIPLFVDRHNKTGIWTYTTNFKDFDNDTLQFGVIAFPFTVLNNLPELDFIRFENLETGEYAYANNLTNFGVFRGTNRLKVTAFISDVEDTWLDTSNYSIQDVTFSLINNYRTGSYQDNTFVFDLKRNGSLGEYLGNQLNYTRIYPEKFTASTNALVVGELPNAANQADLVDSNDGQYHILRYTYGTPAYTKGGEIFYEFTSLPKLYDLNTYNRQYNLTINYTSLASPNLNGPFNIYGFNYNTNQWDRLGTSGFLSDTDGIYTSKSIVFTVAEMSNYIQENSDNKFRIKINSSVILSVGDTELRIDQLYLGFTCNVNNYFEKWESVVTIPAVADSHAGEMKFNIMMKDRDLGIGTNASNIINIYNNAPRFIADSLIVTLYNKKNGITKMNTTASGDGPKYYFDSNDFPQVQIYFNATDDDGDALGVKLIEVGFSFRKGQQSFRWSKTVTRETAIQSGNQYYITVDLNPIGRDNLGDVDQFTLEYIIISDADALYCDPAKFPVTGILINLNYKAVLDINIVQSIDFFWPIVIIGSVAAVTFVFWFYRRFVSYRKYLSKED